MLKRADDARMGADTIGKYLFQPGNISRIRQVKQILSPAEFETAKGFFVQHLFARSSRGAGEAATEGLQGAVGEIVGTRLLNNIAGKQSSYGLPFMREVFSPSELRALTTFAEALKLSQERQAGGLGSMFIQLTQAGAVVKVAQVALSGGAYVTGRPGEAIGVLIAPGIMAKTILNPKVSKLIIEGISLPKGSPRAAGIFTRLVAALMRAHHGQGHQGFDVKRRPGPVKPQPRPVPNAIPNTSMVPSINTAAEFVPY